MSKLLQFDGIRAVAVLLIVLCHVFYGLDGMGSPAGQYLGGTYNFVFFAMSALLIGLNVNKTKSGGGNSFSFLKRRIARLLPELWIFLTLYIIFQLINGVELSPRSVILNYFMLGWFSKLPYIGHLWFVTMIVACYFMFAVLEKCKNKPRTVLILALVCIAGQIALEIKRLPDYFCLVMFMCAVIFMYARLIVEYLQSKKMNWLLPISVIANLLYYWSIDEELLVIGHLPYYYGACISGLTTIVLLYFLFCKIKVGKIMALIAAYSFQIYFVHHPFARNIALFNDYSNSALLSTLCVYAISFVLAYLLKQASDGVRSKIKL